MEKFRPPSLGDRKQGKDAQRCCPQQENTKGVNIKNEETTLSFADDHVQAAYCKLGTMRSFNVCK